MQLSDEYAHVCRINYNADQTQTLLLTQILLPAPALSVYSRPHKTFFSFLQTHQSA